MRYAIFLVSLLLAVSCNTIDYPKKYSVIHSPEDNINIDGALDEEVWQRAQPETGFILPWEDAEPPTTEFRAMFNDDNLYFSFRVEDGDIIIKDSIESEKDLIGEDRVEIYLCPDDQMHHYYCFEIDALGRILDYETIYPRQFDFSWDWDGLTAAASLTDEGYTVEGMISMESLKLLGFPVEDHSFAIRVAMFRAQFNQTAGGEIEEHWLCWVDPNISEPDFHVPSSFGEFLFEK